MSDHVFDTVDEIDAFVDAMPDERVTSRLHDVLAEVFVVRLGRLDQPDLTGMAEDLEDLTAELRLARLQLHSVREAVRVLRESRDGVIRRIAALVDLERDTDTLRVRAAVLREAREEADRIVDEARAEADYILANARARL